MQGVLAMQQRLDTVTPKVEHMNHPERVGLLRRNWMAVVRHT